MHSSSCGQKNTDGWNLDQGLAAQYAAQAGLDPDLAADAGEEVWDVLKSLRDATGETDPKRQAKLVKRTKARLSKANLSRYGELVQHIEARLLALQGRGGDSELAHLTPGEVIVPPQLQTPEVVQAIQQAAQNAGIDMARYTAGSQASSVNPETGMAEYNTYDLEQFDGGRNTPGRIDIEEIIATGRRGPIWTGFIPDYDIDNSAGSLGNGGGGAGGGGDPIEEIVVTGKQPPDFPINYDWSTDRDVPNIEPPGVGTDPSAPGFEDKQDPTSCQSLIGQRGFLIERRANVDARIKSLTLAQLNPNISSSDLAKVDKELSDLRSAQSQLGLAIKDANTFVEKKRCEYGV